MKDQRIVHSTDDIAAMRAQQGAAIVFLAVSGLYLLEARTYPYADYLGPGAGFFPFWIGLLGLVAGVAQLVTATLRPPGRKADAQPAPGGRFRIALTIGLLLAAALALETLGFRLTAMLLIAALLYAYGSSWWASLVIAMTASAVVFFVFNGLGVRLPVNALGF